MHQEAPKAPSELSSEPPRSAYKWFFVVIVVITVIQLWNNNFKVDIVGVIKALMIFGPVAIIIALPPFHRLPEIVKTTIFILLLMFGILFVEMWGEAKVRKWLNKPHWSEQYKKQP